MGGVQKPLLLCFACTASCLLPCLVVKGLPEHPFVWIDRDDYAADGSKLWLLPIITSAVCTTSSVLLTPFAMGIILP